MLITLLVVLTVDILLLSASGRLLELGVPPIRLLLGGVAGSLLTALVWLPGLSHPVWQLAVLLLTGLAGLGFSPSGIGLFLLLQLSLGNLTGTDNGLVSTLLGATGVALACWLVKNRGGLVPVTLNHRGKTLRFRALRDTGNRLRDPLTGEAVLVVGAELARQLTGLTRPELSDPVKSITRIPGLRLIPYQTVGNNGFLLALRIADARVGNRKGSVLVALSPRDLGSNYQALTGGIRE